MTQPMKTIRTWVFIFLAGCGFYFVARDLTDRNANERARARNENADHWQMVKNIYSISEARQRQRFADETADGSTDSNSAPMELPPPDDAPLASEPTPRERGLVLWKGEWMAPEKRATLHAAADEQAAAQSRKTSPPVSSNRAAAPQPPAPAPQPPAPADPRWRRNDAKGRDEFLGADGRYYYFTRTHHLKMPAD